MTRMTYFAALALLAASAGFSSGAQAQAFGGSVDARAARTSASPRTAPLDSATEAALQAQYGTGKSNAFGASVGPDPIHAAATSRGTRLATTSSKPPGDTDLIGSGGAQDALARDIYKPGGAPPAGQ